MAIHTDLQRLLPGNRIRLFEVDGTQFNADILRFHADTLAHTPEELTTAAADETKLNAKSIWWQGKEYAPWPVQIEGLETASDGQQAQPRLTVANLDGSITALCLKFDDMVQAKVIINDTFKHYLDARNFLEGNPEADPTQEKVQVYTIDSKSMETSEMVEFTLSSPADLQGLLIPTRQIHSLCTWAMRGDYRSGSGCDYAGSQYFDEQGNPTDDLTKDRCTGRLVECKKRFGKHNPLPFGGFPGSALIKR
ncbi:phage minor tail protein L [Candidatus Fukatsuia symbiotica]|uniref:Phage minor tail protein L n=1 Tax=Candidatus Fukatsuia symbiotica TaxID=1878942 RepID=A0A2U8I3R2_9GAMM|nr:phage minor tail protein L [Candidatus Fukatsuia symbiotica]AWK13532.1 phage minor tail protein L [Candidatus Fukatsuia symbiotica]AWK13748.1 phage minor tail protein L [Candidatus Fukatsuia symbiotica]MEA9444438.1 phage minor tail protein L [Candidatus Fukatsuia symbiotica]